MAIDINDFNEVFRRRQEEISEWLKSDDAKTIMGEEAVKHYKESFQKQGFTDEKLEPWADVKRRDPNSEWYGKGARATAKILVDSNSLYNAIQHAPTATGTRVFNTMPYGRVHNFGGMAKVYGKKAFQMIARPFIGPSVTMINQIKQELRLRIYEKYKNS